jgi:hypothetical protein
MNNPFGLLVCTTCKRVGTGSIGDNCSNKCPYYDCRELCKGHMKCTLDDDASKITSTWKCGCGETERNLFIKNCESLFSVRLKISKISERKCAIETELNDTTIIATKGEKYRKKINGELCQIKFELITLDKEFKQLVLKRWD